MTLKPLRHFDSLDAMRAYITEKATDYGEAATLLTLVHDGRDPVQAERARVCRHAAQWGNALSALLGWVGQFGPDAQHAAALMVEGMLMNGGDA